MSHNTASNGKQQPKPKMRLRVDGMWRETAGLSHTQLASHMLNGGYWAKYGTANKVSCTRCNCENGSPVEVTLCNLPDPTSCFDALSHSKEVFTFKLTPKCTSSRSHIGSKIVFLVTSVPGIATFSSNPVSLLSRDRRIDRPTSPKPLLSPSQSSSSSSSSSSSPPPSSLCVRAKQHSEDVTRNPLNLIIYSNPNVQTQHIATFCRNTAPHITQSRVHHHSKNLLSVASHLISLDSTSNRQTIVDSRIVPTLPESTIAAIPERVFRRPAIFVSIMCINAENFNILINAMSDYQVPLNFALQYRQLYDSLYIVTTKHQSVENFCYCNYTLSQFARGKNPFQMDLTKPNPIVTIIGWANNTFSQE
ncbi:hypothetical protein Pelo_8189 [Pelomyxa schiedti]|nr:hypothetical protein Pelo_8189 [Pelomyxa schiedti]